MLLNENASSPFEEDWFNAWDVDDVAVGATKSNVDFVGTVALARVFTSGVCGLIDASGALVTVVDFDEGGVLALETTLSHFVGFLSSFGCHSSSSALSKDDED